MIDPKELSQSFREPQEDPSDHCYTILQDHGPNDGGWGPAAVMLAGVSAGPHPFVYTGNAAHVLSSMQQVVSKLAAATGKPTMFCKYSQREDIFLAPGSA